MKTYNIKQTLGAYYALAVIITTVALLPIILSTQQIISWDLSPDWHLPGALGPILAACLVVYFALGTAGLLAFLQSLHDRRFSLKLFLFSISPLLVCPIVTLIVPLFSTQTGQGFAQFPLVWWVSLLISALAYGIGEEAGWRGFALPRLPARMNALWTTVILTVVVVLWHIPFFFYRFQFGFGTTESQPEMSRSTQQQGAASPNEEGVYEIKVKGYLADHWSEWLGNLTISRDDQGNTLLAGTISDQAALHGILAQIRNLGLTLLSFRRIGKGD